MRPARWALLLLAFVACDAAALAFRARVERVADGDSMEVRDAAGRAVGVRLIGIDAPEGRQAHGDLARDALRRLVAGKEVTVETYETDQHGRIVARVLVGGEDAGLAMLRSGLAWVYPWAEKLPERERERYRAAEREARNRRIGLWSDARPVPPWVYRRQARQSAPAPAGVVVGNARSRVYHRRDCPGFTAVAPKHRVEFASVDEAERAGYHLAGNCPR